MKHIIIGQVQTFIRHGQALTFAMILSPIILSAPSWAQTNLSENDFLEALTKPTQARTAPQNGIRTRGVNFNDKAAKAQTPRYGTDARSLSPDQKDFLDDLANRRTRGLSFSDSSRKKQKPQIKTTSYERKKIRNIIKSNDLPSIDLEISFAYNSARLQPKSRTLLNNLGKALLHKRLKNTKILLSGHTDAKGGESYNLSLSEQRADAVKSYLVRRFGIGAGRLIAVGNGEEQLKDSENPNSGKNRRVQIVNMAG